MKNYFVLNGTPSTDFDVYIARSNMFDSAERDYSYHSVPGRSGDLIISNDRFKNFNAKLTVYIKWGMLDVIDHFRDWLFSQHGYQRYEEAERPDEYRMVSFTGPFEIDASDGQGCYITLGFNCKPQRWLSGDHFKGFGAVGADIEETIVNPTYYTSRPLLTFPGTAGATLQVGDVTVSVLEDCGGTVALDCETGNAYLFDDKTNVNSKVAVSGNSLPAFYPGENTIVYSSPDTRSDNRIAVYPRWYTI